MKLAVLLLGMMFFLAIPVFGLDIVEIKFSDDPVEIVEASVTTLYGEEHGNQLFWYMRYVNRSDKAIDALSFRMLFYDVFNEYLGTNLGVRIDKLPPGEEGHVAPTYRSWDVDIYREWSAHTVIVFLDRIRFADGTIWRRSEAEITLELNKLKYILFKPEQLEEKRKE